MYRFAERKLIQLRFQRKPFRVDVLQFYPFIKQSFVSHRRLLSVFVFRPSNGTLINTNKKGMRLCAHVVFYQVSPNTFAGTNFKGTYLTPEDMLQRYSIHNQAKAKCSLPQLELWRNSIKGTISQCFSCLHFRSRKRLQNYTIIFIRQILFCQFHKKWYFCTAILMQKRLK